MTVFNTAVGTRSSAFKANAAAKGSPAAERRATVQQVEVGGGELIVGLGLVEWQLRIAASGSICDALGRPSMFRVVRAMSAALDRIGRVR